MPMPRLAGLDAPGILHHVIGRGIEGKEIFLKELVRYIHLNLLRAGLVKDIIELSHISLGELHSGSRRRDVVEASGSISWIAVREIGYSGADVARYLGVTNSCVTRVVASGQKPDVDDLIRKL